MRLETGSLAGNSWPWPMVRNDDDDHRRVEHVRKTSLAVRVRSSHRSAEREAPLGLSGQALDNSSRAVADVRHG